ncbi:hypothetical protein S40288_02004 [Stachybotrys chartarum IBT 40288]|nr:hypothetical protein S40288_02004 [Stachybotrys chartarum IBT 40288]
MSSWTAFLLAYFLGGVTFIPLVVIVILAHGYYAFPLRDHVDTATDDDEKSNLVQPGDDTSALEAAKTSGKDDAKSRANRDMEVAAGYFAVCREYTPMGINAKPIERSTPVGSATVTSPSPSVYQTMYRSIFDRKPVPGPLDSRNNVNPRPKKAGNVFYVVLRHGHLMLFDDDEQLEVRHVVSLAHHDVSIYSGGDETPEGELFIKRNAICLTRKVAAPILTPDGQVSKPFYLFAEDCSAKEDFYFALLKNQDQILTGGGRLPTPQQFEVKHIISLVQKLHSTEEHVNSRWLNALLGRIFLAVYKTKDLENFIRGLINKKISRVKKPSFLTNINLRRMDIGEAAPFFYNMKLKDLTVEGETLVEADVKYAGNFRIEVATTVKIDLGGRFKVREVNLVLAVLLKRLEGHVLFKVKPPPSNRLWFSFQTMPKMEMAIEPIVSSRQITYTVILRQIENRIKEVLAETLVQPFWDDLPFFKTENKKWRGGIFEDDEDERDPATSAGDSQSFVQPNDGEATARAEELPDMLNETRPFEKSHSLPTLESPQAASTGLFGRKMNQGGAGSATSASSTSLDVNGVSPNSIRSPKILSNSLDPVVGTDLAHATIKPSTSPPDNATNYMAALHLRSQEASPATTPLTSPAKPPLPTTQLSNKSSSSSREALDIEREGEDEFHPADPPRRNTASSTGSASHDPDPTAQSPPSSKPPSLKGQTGSLGRNFFARRDNTGAFANPNSDGNETVARRTTLSAVTTAANTARQWGWNAIQRQRDNKKTVEPPSRIDLSQPMGRGQPLPPPGTPLPGPTNGKTKITPGPIPKRKPVPTPPLPARPDPSQENSKDNDVAVEQQSPALPQRRRRIESFDDASDGENMLVVAAPDDSQPSSPIYENRESIATLAPSINESDKPTPTFRGREEVPSSVGLGLDFASQESAKPLEGVADERDGDDDLHHDPEMAKAGDHDQSQPDDPILALPATTTPDDDDDGYSGWIDDDTSQGHDDAPPGHDAETEKTHHSPTKGLT